MPRSITDSPISELRTEHYFSGEPDNRVVFENNIGTITLDEKGKKKSKQFNFT